MVSRANFNPEIKNTVDSILLKMPDVVLGKMFGYPAYYIDRKLFACVYGDGVGVKVPEGVAQELIGKKGIVNFQPLGKPKMKEWIQINRENPADYAKDIDIFKVSISFVASMNKRPDSHLPRKLSCGK